MFRAVKTGNIFRRPLEAEPAGHRPIFAVWLSVSIALILVATLISVDASTGLKLNQADAESIDPANTISIATANGNGNSVVYGALEWTLVETRLIPRNNDAFSKPVVILEMVARNLDGEHQARVRRRDMVLILEDGSRAPMDRFEHTPSTYRVSVEPGQAVPVTLIFKPIVTHNPWLDDVALEIAEENHRPVVLPLDGSVAPDTYPLVANVAPVAAEQPVTLQIDQLNVDLMLSNASIDINAGQYRAREDEHLLLIQVGVEANSATAPAGGVGGSSPWLARDFWHLELGGQDAAEATRSVDPQRVTSLTTADDGLGSSSSLVQLVFSVPADIELSDTALSAGPEKVKIGSIHPGSVAN